jgi:Fe-S oxidoreductase
MRNNLINLFKVIAEKCIECPLCRGECAFLSKYGNPKEIADRIDPQDDSILTLAFECSLCGLCGAVCPVDLNPRDLFLEMRREAVTKGFAPFPNHKTILDYENRGTSRKYTYYALPDGCDTIFFPGCGLPGTRPKRTLQVYTHLRESIPNLGIVLDCCAKPSHDLGRQDFFDSLFGEMRDYLVCNGVRSVLTACPNCFKIFKEYGNALVVRTIFEVLAEQGSPVNQLPPRKPVAIHDPCAIRLEIPAHEAVRTLVQKQGLPVEEMPHHGVKALCCGEGGAVGLLAPKLAAQWGQRRMAETENRDLVTYCVGCSNLLGKRIPTYHLLDLFFEPEATLQGKVKPSGPPWTYWNRLRLKRRLKKTMKTRVIRERNLTRFRPGEGQ